MTTQLLLDLEEQGRRIRRARNWVLLSQKELAERVSGLIDQTISHNTISQIEKGEVDPRGRVVWAISRVTGQDQAWLQGDPDATFREISGLHGRLITFPGIGLPTQPVPQLAATG